MAKYKTRVKKLITIKASDLIKNPWNFRKHPEKQAEVLREIFDDVGIAGAVIVREVEDGRYQLCDGHLRVDELGDDKIPAIVVDLDEDEAKKLLAVYDPVSAMAETDPEAHAVLTKDLDVIGIATSSLFSELQKDVKRGKKDLGLDIDEDEEVEEIEDVEKDETPKELENSYVKMVQLYLSVSNIGDFEKMIAFLGPKLGTGTLTDTVMKALEMLYKQHGGSEESIVVEDVKDEDEDEEEEQPKKKKKMSKV